MPDFTFLFLSARTDTDRRRKGGRITATEENDQPQDFSLPTAFRIETGRDKLFSFCNEDKC